MIGGVVLGIRLDFHDHTPELTAVVLAFHQPATHQVRSNDFCRAAEEGLPQSSEILDDGHIGDENDANDNPVPSILTTLHREATKPS